jgi:hypothetical protein
MPSFNVKEVMQFLVWIAILLVVAGAILWMLWRAPGQKSVPIKGTTAVLRNDFPGTRAD